MALELGAEITYLGHSSFLVETPGGKNVLIDPWVASNPRCPDDLEIAALDAVLVTHGHFDHVGDALEIYRQHEPEAVVANFEVGHWLQGQGIPEEVVRPMNKGGTQEVLGLGVTMVHATHSSGIVDGERILYGGDPAGYVIELENGKRLYHAGDTAVFPGMELIAELYAPDVSILPIGDHFTMGPREAAKACELLGARRVIPMHYGTFPVLTGTPDAFREACAARGLDVEVIAPEPGETVS